MRRKKREREREREESKKEERRGVDAELDEPRGCGRHIKTINNTSQKKVASIIKKII